MNRQILITLPFNDDEAHVTFTYWPGCHGVHTLSNGDPGYPAESPEVEIISVTVNGAVLELTDEQTEQTQALVLEKYEEQLADERNNQYEHQDSD